MRRDTLARAALPALRFFAAFAEDFVEVFADAFLATRLAGAGEVFLPDLAARAAAFFFVVATGFVLRALDVALRCGPAAALRRRLERGAVFAAGGGALMAVSALSALMSLAGAALRR